MIHPDLNASCISYYTLDKKRYISIDRLKRSIKKEFAVACTINEICALEIILRFQYETA